MKAIKNFINDETGVTALEYGLIAALIAAVILVAVQTIGTKLDTTFDTIAAAI
jgi:pilus assembly protein Flp/PilA